MYIYIFGTLHTLRYFCSYFHFIDCFARYRITDLKSVFLQSFESLIWGFIAFSAGLGNTKPFYL